MRHSALGRTGNFFLHFRGPFSTGPGIVTYHGLWSLRTFENSIECLYIFFLESFHPSLEDRSFKK